MPSWQMKPNQRNETGEAKKLKYKSAKNVTLLKIKIHKTQVSNKVIKKLLQIVLFKKEADSKGKPNAYTNRIW